MLSVRSYIGVNVLKFVFNTQFLVSKHDHIQQSQQTLETKLN